MAFNTTSEGSQILTMLLRLQNIANIQVERTFNANIGMIFMFGKQKKLDIQSINTTIAKGGTLKYFGNFYSKYMET